MAIESLRTVLLETSGRVGQVALGLGSHVIAERRLDEARRHARDLVPALQALLAEQNWQPRDLHAVVVSQGPGSYTGLRVGIISAKAFAYATGANLIVVPTFEAIAIHANAAADDLEIIADAQQDRIYVQHFGRDEQNASLLAIDPGRIESLLDWVKSRNATTWISGPGLRLPHVQQMAELRRVAESLWEPTAESLLTAALPKLARGEHDDVWRVEPLYARASSAEEKWTALGLDRPSRPPLDQESHPKQDGA